VDVHSADVVVGFAAARLDSLSPHAGTVRIFLRLPPFFNLVDPRQVFRLERDRQRRGETPVHHCRIHGLRPAHSVSRHIHSRLDPAVGRQALADASPAYLRERVRRRVALLLAGEVGCPEAADVCGNRGDSAGVSAVCKVDEEPRDGNGPSKFVKEWRARQIRVADDPTGWQR
jgi:hypothetical protein